MAIRVQTQFIRKGTVRVICYVYNDAGALVECSGVKVSIKDPIGEIVADEQTMEPSDTGVYEYLYTTTVAVEEGNYQVECDIRDGTYHTYVHGSFSMKAGINESA